MSHPPISIHPYFRAHPGQLDTVRALLRKFVEKTRGEKKMLRYEFTMNQEEIFCREAYQDAEGVLFHLSNVGELLNEMLKLTDLTRLEIHGPESELQKLKGPLSHFKPTWFVCECGLGVSTAP